MFDIEEYYQHDLEGKRYVVVDEQGMMMSSEHMSLEDAVSELEDLEEKVESTEILSYIEDGELVLAVRSLKEFDGSDFDGEFYFKYINSDNLSISTNITFI